MSKKAMRWCRTGLVGLLVVFLTFDSALACRWRTRRTGGSYATCGTGGVVASQSPIQKGGAPLIDESSAATPPVAPAVPPVEPAVIVDPPAATEASASDKPEPPKEEPAVPEAPQPEPAPPEPVPPEPPKVEPPVEAVPAVPTTPTATPATPAPEPAKPDNFDDLFPPPAEPKPAAPAPSPTEDDPFAPPATPPKPAAPVPGSERDPFAPGPATPPAPAPATPPKPPAVDDDPFAPAPAAPMAPKPTTPAAPAVDDDPFKISAEGTLATREWVDDSGTFRIRGRLIAVLDGKVRILKETGRTTTVPLERLSQADREYVSGLITRYGDDLEDRLAAR